LEEKDLEFSEQIINLFLETYRSSKNPDNEKSNFLKRKYEELNSIINQKISDENMDQTSPIRFIKYLLDLKLKKILL
jgi:hypothetical protein